MEGKFDYSLALELLKRGGRVARSGWVYTKFIYMVPGSEFTVSRAPLLGIFKEGTLIKYRSHIDVCYLDGTCGVWNSTQEDELAEDWVEVRDQAG